MKRTPLDLPKIGQTVYVPTSLYISHGRDDFRGGVCTISRITDGRSAGKPVPFVEIEEGSGRYNWQFLLENQKKLKSEYGNQKGRKDPDFSSESNPAPPNDF